MDTPGQASQAAPVLQHILSFQDDPDQIYLLGGAFNREPGPLQVQINGHGLAPGQVTVRSGCCLAVARSAWEAWVAPGGFTLVEVASGGQHAMKLQRGGPALQVSVRDLLDRPPDDARGAGLQALVRRAFPQPPLADSPAAAGHAAQGPAPEPGIRNKRPAAAEPSAAPAAKAPWGQPVHPAAEPEAAAAARPLAAPEADGLNGEGAAAPRKVRFTREQVAILNDWFKTHVQHPYPTSEDCRLLEAATLLDQGQIKRWLAQSRHWRQVRHPTEPTLNAWAERQPRKEQTRSFTDEVRATLNAWALENVHWPYPDQLDKQALCLATNLSFTQVGQWFKGYRDRQWEVDAQQHGIPWPGRQPRASAASAAQPNPPPVSGAGTESDPPTNPEGEEPQ